MYLLQTRSRTHKSYLYAVSLADNQLKQLSSNCTSNYKVADDYIYYFILYETGRYSRCQLQPAVFVQH